MLFQISIFLHQLASYNFPTMYTYAYSSYMNDQWEMVKDKDFFFQNKNSLPCYLEPLFSNVAGHLLPSSDVIDMFAADVTRHLSLGCLYLWSCCGQVVSFPWLIFNLLRFCYILQSWASFSKINILYVHRHVCQSHMVRAKAMAMQHPKAEGVWASMRGHISGSLKGCAQAWTWLYAGCTELYRHDILKYSLHYP